MIAVSISVYVIFWYVIHFLNITWCAYLPKGLEWNEWSFNETVHLCVKKWNINVFLHCVTILRK
jgi:hypothetical protein